MAFCAAAAAAQNSSAPAHTTEARAAGPVCDRVVFELLQGHYKRALSQLEGVTTTGKSEADVANIRGLALMMSGDLKNAAQSFDRAVDLAPAMMEAHLNRGIARLQAADYAGALVDFQQIWDTPGSPLRARAAYHAALAADAMQRNDEAQAWITRALQADPQLDEALLYSGFIAERRGDLQAAGRAYKSYLDRHPDSSVAMLRFGIAAQRSGFHDTARKYLQKAIDAAPSSDVAVEARKFLVMWE